MSERVKNLFSSIAACGACIAVIGVFIQDKSQIVGEIMVAAGLGIFLCFGVISIIVNTYACPNCGHKMPSLLLFIKGKGSLYRCPKCGHVSKPK